jgi:glycosyltransferase involved in cell wall biosynthesis
MGIPLVWHFHETLSQFSIIVSIGKKIIGKMPHQIVVVAKKAISVFGLPDAILIPGGVDTEFWSKSKLKKRSIRHDSRLRICTVGNLNPLKGFDILLRALEAVHQPWELMIIGAELHTHAEYARKLRVLAQQLESPSRHVCFAGWMSPEAIESALSDCDLFVLPSISEACPLVLLEAMAVGCHCIATDVGDVSDILERGKCGSLVPPSSQSSLVSAIEQATRVDVNERERLGQNARFTVKSKYSSAIQLDMHLNIYKKLASHCKELA